VATKAEIEREVDRLYRLPLSEFTPARDELARRLRSDGNRERAEEVKKLRKPTAAVWLVNQLARERELDVQRLLKAGESLTRAQSKAAAGQSSRGFLEARRDEHDALERLAKAAHEIAAREGVGAAAVTKATETLRGAALSGEGRRLLKRGRLTEELQPPGFEALTGLQAVAPARSARKNKRSKTDERAEKRRMQKDARRRVQQLRIEEREAASVVRAAEREAERVEGQASAAEAAAEKARAAARAVADEREAAETELTRLS
jgi:hypothetical protein